MEKMLDDLAGHDVVFLGESHLDDFTHRFELEVYEGLAARRPIVLALEMFERDVQPVLDDYLAGRIDEKAFLERSRPWHNYWSGYRPLVEAAKRRRRPVVASNAPRPVLNKIAAAGGIDKLAPEDRAHLASEIHDTTDDYWERFGRATRGHAGAGSDRVTSVQNLWDNTMGESCAKALAAHPGALVLHVNGGFHSAYRRGTVHQLLKRRPDARVAVVEIAAVDDFIGLEPFGTPDRADYVAYVLARARAPQQGFHAVTAFSELRYRLHLPPGLASGKMPPLVVWLGDEGFRAADALGPLAEEFGEDVALAVVEPPYPMLADDLAPGGRWFTGETFEEDLGVLGSGVSRIVAHVLRTYPIDPRRVVLAGEGAGGTIVAATALYERDLEVPAFAIRPARYGKLRMLGLPGSEGAPGARRLLVAVGADADEEWWEKEAEDWGAAGLPVEVVRGARGEAVARVREALGLEPRTKEGTTTALLLLRDTPRARLWAETYASRLPGPAEVITSVEQWKKGSVLQPLAFDCEPDLPARLPLHAADEGGGLVFDTANLRPAFSAESLMDGRGLPLPHGPFGGTTILVLPAGASEERVAAWKKLAETDAIKKKSRFARLVVVSAPAGASAGDGADAPADDAGAAGADGDVDGGVVGAEFGPPPRVTGLAIEGLPAALQAVKDAGRSVVVVVPAVFCADAEMMAEIRAAARPFEDILDMTYLPGLGGGALPPEPPSK